MNCQLYNNNGTLILLDTNYGMHYQGKFFELNNLNAKGEPYSYVGSIVGTFPTPLEEFHDLFYYLNWDVFISKYKTLYPEYFI